MKKHITHLVASLLAASAASAAINIDTVLVGNAGNANDIHNHGAVNYDYYIGTYEVTNSQYAAFLNDAALSDPHGLWNFGMGDSFFGGINQTGSDGSFSYSVKAGYGDKPVTFVSFWDAARFSNWLTTGDTESGVYNLNDTTNPSNGTIARDSTAWANGGVAVASENEWYKAAYYDGNGGFTWYPTQSDEITTDEANYDNSVRLLTDVGAYSDDASFYGTFDQGGNAWEWNDAILGNDRGVRGGAFDSSVVGMRTSDRNDNNPTVEGYNLGFRVSSLAPIPEPSTYAAILGCIGLTIALTRRKVRGTL